MLYEVITYVNKTVSEFFEGNQEIKKISSESELREILAASNLFGQYYNDVVFPVDEQDGRIISQSRFIVVATQRSM